MTGKIQGKRCIVRRCATLMMIIAFSVMVFGCGSSGSKSSKTKTSKPKGTLNACSVLSEKIASEVLHDKVTKSNAFPRNTEIELQGGKVQNSICSYSAVSSGRTLGLNLYYSSIYRGNHPTLEAYKKGASAKEVGEPVAVKGIGDFAVWNIAYGAGVLIVYAGDYKAIITIRSKSKSARNKELEPAKKAAKEILANL